MNKIKTLAVGTIAMLFLGLVYAWSLFAAPLEQDFGWLRSETSLTFTISMICFCLGSVATGILLPRFGPRPVVWGSATMILIGFIAVSMISSLTGLYVFYGFFIGFGSGVSYNVILSIVPLWYPDRNGMATGTLMMGMGLGSLLLGSGAKVAMQIIGWQMTFRLLAVLFFIIFFVAGLLIQKPQFAVVTPGKTPASEGAPTHVVAKKLHFWVMFCWTTMASGTGLAIVSNVAYIAEDFGAAVAVATLSVGVVSVGNGAGRLVFGAIFDVIGLKKTMYLVNATFMVAILLLLANTRTYMLPLMFLGLVLLGLCYGASPTLSTAGIKAMFGARYFPSNLALIMLAMIPASIIGPSIASTVFMNSGSYAPLYMILLGMNAVGFLMALLLRTEPYVDEGGK